MKKVICVLSIFAIFIVNAISVDATVVSDALIGSPEYRYITDAFSGIEQIEKNCIESYGKNENDEEKYSGLSFVPELAFKVYEYTKSSSEFQTDSIISIVEEDCYSWKIPIENSKGDIVVISTFSETDGKWQLVYYGLPSNSEIDYLTDKNATTQLRMKIGISEGNFKKAKTIFLSRYYITALYVESEKENYIIPIETIESLNHDLVKYKEYSVDEFTKILSNADFLLDEEGLAEKNAGTMKTPNSLASTVAVIALCVIVTVGTILVILRKKGRN